MLIKRYLEHIVCQCSDEKFGQDAVEWAVTAARVRLTFDEAIDLQTIMGNPGLPNSGLYEWIVEAYQRELHSPTALLVESYAPLLEQIATFPVERAA